MASSQDSIKEEPDDTHAQTNNNLMMELPTPVPALNPIANAKRSITELTEEEKSKLIEDCTLRLISPQVKDSSIQFFSAFSVRNQNLYAFRFWPRLTISP